MVPCLYLSIALTIQPIRTKQKTLCVFSLVNWQSVTSDHPLRFYARSTNLSKLYTNSRKLKQSQLKVCGARVGIFELNELRNDSRDFPWWQSYGSVKYCYNYCFIVSFNLITTSDNICDNDVDIIKLIFNQLYFFQTPHFACKKWLLFSHF